MRFKNRLHAGRELAHLLKPYAGRSDVLVLGLPRGGLPVAAEVARALDVPFDVFLVRKLGVPGHEELAFGAIAEGGVEVLNERLIADIGLPRPAIERVAVRERLELERRDKLYRGGRRFPGVEHRVVLLIDDGLATGATMEAAVMALRPLKPARIVVAVPLGARETCDKLARIADEVVCVAKPEPFDAVGLWYDDFTQTTDDEVRALLARAGHAAAAPRTAPSGPVDVLDVVRRRARPFTGDAADDDALIEQLGQARVVLLGEATHGTHEFYRQRALITRRLIVEHGFQAVAVEADWPDAYRINRYVRGAGTDRDAVEALTDFRRFPAWMWRNADVLDFVGWLRSYNENRPATAQAGFYGLDLYSLHASARAVLTYLDKVDPPAAEKARRRYACFDQFGEDPQDYAYATGYGMTPSCEREVVSQLVDLRRQAADYARRDGRIAADEFFVAEQNARVVRDAEAYYRTMVRGHVESWNLRDRHMVDTLAELIAFLDQAGRGKARVVVWAHNSHLGDARATEMGEHGELNVGQLVRERFGADAMLVGFTSYTGTVTAATEWDGPAHRRHLRPAHAGSYEFLFHETRLPRFALLLRTDLDLASALEAPRLERAVGVLYLPETERRSHYFHAKLSRQFDVVLHFDETRAVEPLERTSAWVAGEVAETYPSGL
jgi:erythromycin esterase-like protein/adenine/guanine phosphoribosyltransferase-like PRPP-binding protein